MIETAIINGNMQMLDFLGKGNGIQIPLHRINFVSLTKNNRLSNDIILKFKRYVDISCISKWYDLSDDSIIILADILDWCILPRSHILSEVILTKYRQRIPWYDFFYSRQIVYDDNWIDIFMNSQDANYCTLINFIAREYLTSTIFRKYFHMFEDHYEHILRKYNEQFFLDTADLVNWKEIPQIYYQCRFRKNLQEMKKFF